MVLRLSGDNDVIAQALEVNDDIMTFAAKLQAQSASGPE